MRGLVAEPYNPTNEWQREFRVGWFDAVMAEYAVTTAGGQIHQLALSHLDVLPKRATWPVVTGYSGQWPEVLDPNDFTAREGQAKRLMGVAPDRACTMVAAEQVPSFISERLRIPIGIEARGPSYTDRTFLA